MSSNVNDASDRLEASSSQNTSDSVQFIELPEAIENEQDASTAAPLVQSLNPLHQIKTKLQVCVGQATLTVGELLSAKEHQVLTLDRSIDQPVDLLLEGAVVARGQLVAVSENFAVRITQLPVQLKS